MARRPQSSPAAPTATTPVLPVRDTVHFPGLVNTVMIIRERSQRAIRAAMESDRCVLVLAQRDHNIEEPEGTDLFEIGTLSEILQSVPMPDGSQRVVLRGLRRMRARNVTLVSGRFMAEPEEQIEVTVQDAEIEALMRAVLERFIQVVELNKEIPAEALHGIQHLDDPGLLADTLSHHLPIRPAEKQSLLQELNHRRRLDALLSVLMREEQVLEIKMRIQDRVRTELGDSQREFFLREQLRTIQRELRDSFGEAGEFDDLESRIAHASLPEIVRQRAEHELRRLERMAPSSHESAMIRDYIELLVAMPWTVRTKDRIDIDYARQLLDSRHFGLEAAKERILDDLAVRKLRGTETRGSILCLVGPPGVGKTSLGRVIADAMGRKFVRVALGGVRDEAEIRGHRRAYVGASPGRLVQAIRDTGSLNPVVMLDEIDKLVGNGSGDPASALLEALDAEQNERFVDHFLEVPLDLGQVIFVATANAVDFIPSPLRDRMEMIGIPGYTESERFQIASVHLLPAKLRENGLDSADVNFPAGFIESVVRDYTREAGVRGLGRKIETICRKIARRVAEGESTPIHINTSDLSAILGQPVPHADVSFGGGEVGVVKGLVVSDQGGDIVEVEVSALEPIGEHAQLRLTGNLGKIMQESAEAAWSCVRSVLPNFAPDTHAYRDIHIHVPDGAIPKDGPSAGITIATAIASALTGRKVRARIAMTGEISLRGRVLAVGGIRDKVLAAVRYGMEEVIIPKANAADLEQIPEESRSSIRITLVSTIEDVLHSALQHDVGSLMLEVAGAGKHHRDA